MIGCQVTANEELGHQEECLGVAASTLFVRRGIDLNVTLVGFPQISTLLYNVVLTVLYTAEPLSANDAIRKQQL